jgi:hypothetical protein
VLEEKLLQKENARQLEEERLVPPFSPLLLSLSNMLSSKNAFAVLENNINNNMKTTMSELLEVLDDRIRA